jgi:putative protease|tara:strand:- start:12284 stop:13501 length:1218 start_codon:yes stop_codon:yes gene_type:complete
MDKLELMSPISNWEMLQAALDSGTDAVYFGVQKLNMRATAKNFTLKDLSKITKLCKKSKVKTYLTVNTLVYEDELKDLDSILKAAKGAKIDMIICWDLAVLKKAHELGLKICISTQASISNSKSAEFYKKIGADRIVLARECNLDQIKDIKKNVDIEIEIFIHGAMCISVSGRCFLSHHLFNRSANRGDCLQPCRREYLIKDREEDGNELILGKDYVMSPKDLCTIEIIDQLIDAGIDSLKIEGRKRSPEYVAAVTQAYRTAIDLHFESKLTPQIKSKLKQDLETVFNRGFSTGFYLGLPTQKDYVEKRDSSATQKKEYIGTLTNYFKKINVASLKIHSGSLKLEDEILIQGPKTGSLKVKISNLRYKDKEIKEALKEQEISFFLSKEARKNDKVYLIKQNTPKD